MEALTFIYKKMGTIRGTRHYIKVIKECKNIPGFAPETYDREVCEIVKEFAGDENYTQFFGDSIPNVEIEEWLQITEKIKEPFNESQHNFDKE